MALFSQKIPIDPTKQMFIIFRDSEDGYETEIYIGSCKVGTVQFDAEKGDHYLCVRLGYEPLGLFVGKELEELKNKAVEMVQEFINKFFM